VIRVGVSGAAGRMGELVATTVAGSPDLELGALYDPNGDGRRVAGMTVVASPEAMREVDVVVEFTNPAVVLDNLRRWGEFGRDVVVGTSGFSAERIEAVRGFWGTGEAKCLIVPNFSIGAVVMMRLAELAAPHFDAAEIIELHHDGKADAPSGTAIATAGRIAAAGGEARRKVESNELIVGARGALADGVSVHAVRLPGLVAHQAVMFGGTGETLTIRHDTTDRAAFMPGVLLAIRNVAGLAMPVTVGLESLLGL
jgi:4-hydroxy-tetrahydrodipicolinate reductase